MNVASSWPAPLDRHSVVLQCHDVLQELVGKMGVSPCSRRPAPPRRPIQLPARFSQPDDASGASSAWLGPVPRRHTIRHASGFRVVHQRRHHAGGPREFLEARIVGPFSDMPLLVRPSSTGTTRRSQSLVPHVRDDALRLQLWSCVFQPSRGLVTGQRRGEQTPNYRRDAVVFAPGQRCELGTHARGHPNADLLRALGFATLSGGCDYRLTATVVRHAPFLT